MPMFQNAIEYLRERLTNAAGTEIEIRRGGESLGTFNSVMARSFFDDVDGTQKRVTLFSIDFIIRGDSGYRPQVNDRVIYNNRTFVVRPVAKETWRYDDPYEIMIRIHTREEAQTNNA